VAAVIPYWAIVGAIVGGVAGSIEALISMRGASSVIRPADLFAITCFYSIVWSAVSAVAGILHCLFRLAIRRPDDRAATKAFSISTITSLLAFVMGAGYVNATFLPSMVSATSLLFDAGFLLFCGFLWLVQYRLLRRFLGPQPRYFTLKGPLALCSLLFALLVALSFALSSEKKLSKKGPSHDRPAGPNVLILVLDALRADHLGCYGYRRPTSPTIDRLASQGVLFLNAYTQAPLTKQSVASIWTSLYPSAHNVKGIADGLPANCTTLMEAMKAAGYRTGVFSANGFLSPLFGFDRGVDLFYCQKTSIVRSTILGHVIVRIGRAVPHMDWVLFLLRKGEVLLPLRGQGGPFVPVNAQGLGAALLRWIDAAPQEPFIAYVQYMETHAPYASPPELTALFDPDFPGPPVIKHPQAPQGLLPFFTAAPLEERYRANLVANYDGAIRSLDGHIERLLHALEARGILDKTLVIVTADHGEEFYDHKGWGHGQSLFEELVRVPLIFWSPGHLPRGKKIEQIVNLVDLMPTVLAAARAAEKAQAWTMQGRNLWPALVDGREPGGSPHAFSEVYHGPRHLARSLRQGWKKAIYSNYDKEEIVMVFDLKEDPFETKNLALTQPREAAALLDEMAQVLRTSEALTKQTHARTIDEATRERLKALGYIQ
jgi:arylsulfatase A-like enzyme